MIQLVQANAVRIPLGDGVVSLQPRNLEILVSFSGQAKTRSVEKRCKRSATWHADGYIVDCLVLIGLCLVSKFVECVTKPSGKGLTPGAENKPRCIVNRSVTVKITPDEIVGCIVVREKIAPCHRAAFAGNDSKPRQVGNELPRVNCPAIRSFTLLCLFCADWTIGRYEITNEHSQAFVKTDKAALPNIADISVGRKQAEKITQVACPVIKCGKVDSVTPFTVSNGMGIVATRRAKSVFISGVAMPGRAHNFSAAMVTRNCAACVSASWRAGLSLLRLRWFDLERFAATSANQCNRHLVTSISSILQFAVLSSVLLALYRFRWGKV